uniref:Carbamoyl phosphate synthase arginine-specific large chain n=1 Tax=Parabodo caudatus TaxID=351713 RepID=A9CQ01_9EUGL|nr:carbamoyl-phosphate synthetase II [Parabodo caudatus]
MSYLFAESGPQASLVLRDGNVFSGVSFGAAASVAGEVVFATGMVGYPEALTDPSYSGQILVLTYPMIGNYGVPGIERDAFGVTKNFESEDGIIHVSGVIVSECCSDPVHWQSLQSLDKWLKSQNIPGLMMVDTRAIVLKLREMGTALGKIVVEGNDVPFHDPNTTLLTEIVSTKAKRTYGHGNTTILCIDMGVKLNIIRCFLRYDTTFVVVPHNHDISQENYDGLFISNGPGNPEACFDAIRSVKWALTQDKPIFGVCMGNQILAIAAGGKTYKMKYGHRGQNQPCRRTSDNRVMITTQNHGYAVDASSLGPEWEQSFINPNDDSNEGIRHRTKPFSAVQFHPEGRCGPEDTEFLIKDFVDEVKKCKQKELVNWQPRKVLVLGAGGITIAQAGEFDYSGSQCLKSLKEEGIETVLVNPNIATVQTDDAMADHIYFVPVTPECVERVIEKERPDGILLGWGGQTALNCGIQLNEMGVFKKYNVRVLGTQVSTIAVTEDRELFRDALLQIGEHVAESHAATSLEDAMAAAKRIGFPVMVRAAFCLGGQGSGIVNTEEELRSKVTVALATAPQVLIEQSVAGWKEIEYEVVRDIYDNCITVCNMENFDPMGIHTGESTVVAPSQTLSNDEYHMLRSASIKIIRHLGVVGECNVQYGLDPYSHRYVVIEVNARLSRSSALASKATGYPLAHVATKLALGKPLPAIVNGVTKNTTACFEPSLDYCVVKIPRWDLNKFNMVSRKLGSMMKSVGEVMSIGRSFEEAMQKALRMVDPSFIGFDVPCVFGEDWDYEKEIRFPTSNRIWAICKALHQGVAVDTIFEWSKINKFFLYKLERLVLVHKEVATFKCVEDIPAKALRAVKELGFSDQHLAKILGTNEEVVRSYRHSLNILPFVKQIDTVAGETAAQTNYLYTSYNAQCDDIDFGEEYFVVLGCGVYRIGNSVEFDYGGVLVTRELRRLGHKVIMINYNPETVSTDYDECDRLYFEELSLESITDILRKEKTNGIVISLGGQIVQNLALKLKASGFPILGTDPLSIDMAEDRNKFSKMCDDIGVSQPEWISAKSLTEVEAFCKKVDFPCLVRPSYVLSGSAMSVISNMEDINKYFTSATIVSGEHPVVVSKYYENALEYDLDIVAHCGKILCYSISEHIEPAGVHSGDATMLLPPRNRDKDVMKALYEAACKIADRLQVTGPMNVQLLITPDRKLKVIEANVRCSRSVPFVSKTLGISFPAVMVSAFLSGPEKTLQPIKRAKMSHIGCKASMFSFNRLSGADPILGVEMHSTGEVGVFGRDLHEVVLKAMLCQNFKYPSKGCIIHTERASDAAALVPYAKLLSSKLKLFAAPVAFAELKKGGVDVLPAYTRDDPEQHPLIEEMYEQRSVDLVIQVRDKTRDFYLRRCSQETAPSDYWVRRLAVDFGVALITELEIAKLFAEAFVKYTPSDIEIEPFRSYVPKIYHKLENNNCTLLRRHKVGLCVADGLDSRVLALRLRDEQLNLVCFHADVGQKANIFQLTEEFASAGLKIEVVDLRDRMAECCFDIILSHAIYENRSWQIRNIERHVIGSGVVPAMRARKITVCAQASARTKKEARFERYVKTLFPEMGVYTPWRDVRMREDFATDADKLAYAAARGMVISPANTVDPSCLNLAGAAWIGRQSSCPLRLTKLPRECSNEPEFVSLTFASGRCTQVNGQAVTPLQAMVLCNDIGGRNGMGIGRTADGDILEAPGLTLIACALKHLYEDVLDRQSLDMLRTYSSHVSNQLAAGMYADNSTQSALAAIRFLAKTVYGVVTLELHKGNAIFLKAEHGLKQGGLDPIEYDDVFLPGNGSFSDIEW